MQPKEAGMESQWVSVQLDLGAQGWAGIWQDWAGTGPHQTGAGLDWGTQNQANACQDWVGIGPDWAGLWVDLDIKVQPHVPTLCGILQGQTVRHQ